MEQANVILITQARTGSSRLPGKVLLEINEKSLLEIHLERVRKSILVDEVIVATTTDPADYQIVNLCNDLGVDVFCGSEKDVLERYYQSALRYKPRWVVRVTSDCPLIDPQLIDAIIQCAITNDVDYCSNGLIEQFPDGQDVEVFKFKALEIAYQEAVLNSDREHVTPFIRRGKGSGKPFKTLNFPCREDYSKVRMTVDEEADFNVIKGLIDAIGIDKNWLEYTRYLQNSEISKLNSDIIRNEGYLKSQKND